jgi:DNA adenine methylase
MIKTLRPPIGRIGGKSLIAKQLVSQFPEYTTYVEPFFGAGSVFYAKQKSNIEIINDLDEDMYIIIKGLQTNGVEINDTIYRHPSTREQWLELKGKKDAASLMRFYTDSFFSSGRTYNVSRSKSLSSTNRKDYTKYQDRLKDVSVYNRDYKELINEFDSETTFFYLDPPYEGSKDYKNRVIPNDVRDALINVKGKFMLSYNDSPLIRELFKDYIINEVTTMYSRTQNINNRQKKELVITNY